MTPTEWVKQQLATGMDEAWIREHAVSAGFKRKTVTDTLHRLKRRANGSLSQVATKTVVAESESLTAGSLRRRCDVKTLIRDYLVSVRKGLSIEQVPVVEERKLKQAIRADHERFERAVRSPEMQPYRMKDSGLWYWAEPDVIEYIETPED